LENGNIIERAEDIRDLYATEEGIELKVSKIRSVMKNQLGMRYSKIINIAI
jgi:hypothetical protein